MTTVRHRQQQERLGQLTDAVYDAAFNPAGWPGVMRLMKQHFGSAAETFYLLDRGDDSMRPVHIDGIDGRWLDCFAPAYFAPDNPWIALSDRLHRPGVVRTNERLDAFVRTDGALYRSSYYNDWMRPQGLRFSLGNTLLREPGLIANITLLRDADRPTFGVRAVRDFETLSDHLTRAVRLAIRLEDAAADAPGESVFEALPQAAFVVDGQGRILQANAAAERLLREGAALAISAGRLIAGRADEREAFARAIASAASDAAAASLAGESSESDNPRAAGQSLVLRAGARDPQRAPQHGGLRLDLMPLAPHRARFRSQQRAVLVTARPAPQAEAPAATALVQAWGLTPSEARLVHALGLCGELRAASARCGIGLGTARGYLKLVFQKTGVHRQAELLALMRREWPG